MGQNVINKELWIKIESFNFDSLPSEYGFLTRLARENYWTKAFTNQAITEYKKFMYLAATSDFMVSPSEIIDKVWHQHLIFTQSYEEFCVILGKKIQHIPSTRNQSDFKKFKQAKERTVACYENNFGNQPKNIWNFSDMFESLNLKKARMKIRTFIIINAIAFVGLTIPAYHALKPIYQKIDNPNFINVFIFIIAFAFIALEVYNRKSLKKIVNQFDETSFINNLEPLELIYLKTKNLSDSINWVVNELIGKRIVEINKTRHLKLIQKNATETLEELQITDALSKAEQITYPALLARIEKKPIFSNTVNCVEAFRKYFFKSKKFGFLFYTNFYILSALLLISTTRVATGVIRHKPVAEIVLVTLILMALAIAFLFRFANQMYTTTIPQQYKRVILPTLNDKKNSQWRYFLHGEAVLRPDFLLMINYFKGTTKRNDSGSSSCRSSCGSSCGSSCSSCGGCGGD